MSSDAVDATPISYDLVELSEDDQIKEQEELIKELDEPDTLTNFVKACKNIGKTAVDIDNDFLSVKYGFDELVEKYGKDFPKVKSDFLPRWEGFMAVSQDFHSRCSWIIFVHASVGLGNQGFSGLQKNLQAKRRLHWLVSCSLGFFSLLYSQPHTIQTMV